MPMPQTDDVRRDPSRSLPGEGRAGAGTPRRTGPGTDRGRRTAGGGARSPTTASRSGVRPPHGARRRARLTAERLAWVHPARSEIEFESRFQLLVAVLLSARSTDRMAARLARELLARYPDPAALAAAELEEVERILRPIGFFRVKSRALIAVAQVLDRRHHGRVPGTMAELLELPGIGRKSANTILGVGFGVPGIIADRHLIRVAGRVRLVHGTDPDLVEAQIWPLLPRSLWTPFSLRTTLHGRYVCLARRPLCERCVLNDFCPSSTTAGLPMEERRRIVMTLARRPPGPSALGPDPTSARDPT
jgi:endonuclease-3